ncbi:hypothetical protein ACP70R_027090 [Stipagrostis hirtigluma subsp. patula]
MNPVIAEGMDLLMSRRQAPILAMPGVGVELRGERLNVL